MKIKQLLVAVFAGISIFTINIASADSKQEQEKFYKSFINQMTPFAQHFNMTEQEYALFSSRINSLLSGYDSTQAIPFTQEPVYIDIVNQVEAGIALTEQDKAAMAELIKRKKSAFLRSFGVDEDKISFQKINEAYIYHRIANSAYHQQQKNDGINADNGDGDGNVEVIVVRPQLIDRFGGGSVGIMMAVSYQATQEGVGGSWSSFTVEFTSYRQQWAMPGASAPYPTGPKVECSGGNCAPAPD